MIDEEVEIALREIRERVVSQPIAAPPAAAARPENGGGAPQAIATPPRSAETIARLNAHLTTTARAWDRLPPVFSNRAGTAARLELWLKARLKTCTRWFTWEQVNFNAAVHHALGEALQTLTEQNGTIAALQSKLDYVEAERVNLRAEIDIQRDDIHSLRAQIQSDIAAKHIELQNQQRETNSLRAEARGELEALRIKVEDLGKDLSKMIEARNDDTGAQLAEVAAELRERAAALENDQRVCFKQLSLEVNENAILLDRMRTTLNQKIQEPSKPSKP